MNPFDHLNRIARDAARPVFALVFSAAMVDILPHGVLTAVFIGTAYAAAAWLAVYLLGLCGWLLSQPHHEEEEVAPALQRPVNRPERDDDPLAAWHTTLTAARANGRLPSVSINKLTSIGIRKDVAGNPAKACRQALLELGYIDSNGRFTPLGQRAYPSPTPPDVVEVAATTSGGSLFTSGGGGRQQPATTLIG